MYANTFYSLVDRLDETGYLEESFVPGRYPGCFARSAGAYVFLMTQAGEVELAVRALRFVLDSMRRAELSRSPHVLGKPYYGKDGKLLQELDMVCQIDGTAHILSAYAELVLVYKREELFEEYWGMMAKIMDAHADQPCFFANEIMRNTVESLRRRLWKEDPNADGLYFLSKDAEPDGSFCLETIGKGIGWDIEAALSEGDYRHICEQLSFLEKKHREELYGECIFYKNGQWKTRDCGNAEQCIWWCRAICRLRKTLGMPGVPDRRDITIHYSADLAYPEQKYTKNQVERKPQKRSSPFFL